MLCPTDKNSNDCAVPSGFEDSDALQNHGLNGVQSRAQSESSGEFSMSLENEPWSNGSSPVQHPPSRRSSSSFQPPCDTSTPQHTLKHHREKASTLPAANSLQHPVVQSLPKQRPPVLSHDFWLARGTKSIRRGSRGKVARRLSDGAGALKMNPGVNGVTSKAETSRALVCSPITVLYVQGQSSSMSGCLNCFSTPLGKQGRRKGPGSPTSLPRASSVISTAEGSSRRASVIGECRVPVKIDSLSVQVSDTDPSSQPEPETIDNEPEPPVKSPRDPAAVVVAPTDDPIRSPVEESLFFDSSFTFNSVFSNTIFSDSAVTTVASMDALENNQSVLGLNPSLVHDGPLESEEVTPDTPQTLTVVNEQSQNAEHAPGLMEEKDKTLAMQ